MALIISNQFISEGDSPKSGEIRDVCSCSVLAIFTWPPANKSIQSNIPINDTALPFTSHVLVAGAEIDKKKKKERRINPAGSPQDRRRNPAGIPQDRLG